MVKIEKKRNKKNFVSINKTYYVPAANTNSGKIFTQLKDKGNNFYPNNGCNDYPFDISTPIFSDEQMANCGCKNNYANLIKADTNLQSSVSNYYAPTTTTTNSGGYTPVGAITPSYQTINQAYTPTIITDTNQTLYGTRPDTTTNTSSISNTSTQPVASTMPVYQQPITSQSIVDTPTPVVTNASTQTNQNTTNTTNTTNTSNQNAIQTDTPVASTMPMPNLPIIGSATPDMGAGGGSSMPNTNEKQPINNKKSLFPYLILAAILVAGYLWVEKK